jgi:DeoR/GlpR family transcriptional regulator of sugar metabolism
MEEGRMSKTDERELAVLELLKSKEKLSTEDVAALLAISNSSVRRLFLALEKNGKVARVYGGIKLVSNRVAAYSFNELELKYIAEKRSIAKYAANMLEDADIVYLDSGTTLFQMAIAIKERIRRNSIHDLRIVTNSYANLEVLDDVCEVILVGGAYRPIRKDFAGYASEKFVQCFNYRKAFLGADGLDLNEGFMGTDTDTARLNEILLSRAEEVYVLLDSSKIGVRSFVTYTPADKIRAVVTDQRILPETEALCLQKGINIIKANEI